MIEREPRPRAVLQTRLMMMMTRIVCVLIPAFYAFSLSVQTIVISWPSTTTLRASVYVCVMACFSSIILVFSNSIAIHNFSQHWSRDMTTLTDDGNRKEEDIPYAASYKP